MALAPVLVRQQNSQVPAAIAYAVKPFKDVAPEKESRMGIPIHEIDPRLQTMIDAWESVSPDFIRRIISTEHSVSGMGIYSAQACGAIYREFYNAVKGINCTAAELETFVLFLSTLEKGHLPLFERKAGLFISAFVNDGAEQYYVVRTGLIGSVSYLGFFNRRDLLIEGDAGDYAGCSMRCGQLSITGSAGSFAVFGMLDGTITIGKNADDLVGCSMRGGELTVNGNVRDMLGAKMKSGKINVKGNAGEDVGINMRGGDLTVGGNASSHVGDRLVGGTITVVGSAGIVGVSMNGGRVYVGSVSDVATEAIVGGRIFVGGVQVYPPRAPESVQDVV